MTAHRENVRVHVHVTHDAPPPLGDGSAALVGGKTEVHLKLHHGGTQNCRDITASYPGHGG